MGQRNQLQELEAEIGHLRGELARLQSSLEWTALSCEDRPWREIVEHMNEGAATCDFAGRILYCNGKLAEMTRKSRDELSCAMMESVLLPKEQEQFRAIFEWAKTTGARGQFHLRRDGEMLAVQISINMMRLDSIEMMTVVVTDLSEHIRVGELTASEEELRLKAEKLGLTKQAAETERLKYQEMFSFAPDGYFETTPKGVIEEANQVACKLLGLKDIKGRALIDFISEPDYEHYTEVLKHLREQDGILRGIELEIVTAEGKTIPVNIAAAATIGTTKPLKFRWLVRDVSEQKKAEQALRESEILFRELAEHANAIIAIVQGRNLIFANPKLSEMSGYSHEELMRVDIGDLIAPEFRDRMVDWARRRQMGEDLPNRYEFRLLTRSGVEKWMDFSVARITYRGKPALTGIVFDITKHKEIEAQLRQSEERMRTLLKG